MPRRLLPPRRGTSALLVTAVAAVLATAPAACSGSSGGSAAAPTVSVAPTSPSTAAASPSAAAHHAFVPKVVGTVATGLSVPWGLAFLPDRSALVTERDRGEVLRIATDGTVTSVGTVPGVRHDGEGGLLGIAVDPDFAKQPWVYVYFTSDEDNRVVRMKLEDGKLGAIQVVLVGLARGPIHDGGRIAFGPDGYLYVGVGETGNRALAQNLSSPNGKILRITTKGDPAPGNPFPGSPVYSYGHRNVQGLAWDATGQLWASEFGQDTWDELNKIEAGKNYGWPIVEGRSADPRLVNPQAQWHTDLASPSGIAIVGDHVLMAALRGQRLWVIPVKAGTAGKPHAYFVGTYGRLRTVAAAPDGSVWLVTNNTDGRGIPKPGDDKILRLTY